MNIEVKNGKVYNAKGEVAVLISHGFGAGWSTWNDQDCLFTPEVVLSVLEGRVLTSKALREIYGSSHFCSLGIDGLTVEWIPKGTLFRVDEYDGSESLVIRDDLDWNVA